MSLFKQVHPEDLERINSRLYKAFEIQAQIVTEEYEIKEYKDTIVLQLNQQKEIAKKIADMSKSGELDADAKATKKRRWDQSGAPAAPAAPHGGKHVEEHLLATPAQRQIWDATPAPVTESETPGRAMGLSARRRWDETPRTERGNI